jgi:hypothetical protein
VSDPFAQDVIKFARNGTVLSRWVRAAAADATLPRLELRDPETPSRPSPAPSTRAPWFSCPVSIAIGTPDAYILDPGRSAVVRFRP